MGIPRLHQTPARIVPLENGWGERGSAVVPLDKKFPVPNYCAFQSYSFDDRLNFAITQTPEQFYYYDSINLLSFSEREKVYPINKYVKFSIMGYLGSVMVKVIYSQHKKGPYLEVCSGLVQDIDDFLVQADRLLENGVEGAAEILSKESYMRGL